MLRGPTLAAAALLVACTADTSPTKPTPAPAEPATPPAEAAPPAPRLTPEAIAAEVKAAMDPSQDPCHDFYAYACGGWIAKTELPGDQSRWGRSFGILRERNRETMREILEESGRKTDRDDEAGKLGRFYAACMDEAAVGAAGVEPLAPLFAQIAGVTDAASFMTVVGKLHPVGVRPVFGIYVGPDDKDPKINIAHVFQGGLGLPDRDYYFDKKRAELLAAYERHVAKIFALAGEPEDAAAKLARDVVALETALAGEQLTTVERRDADRTYNKIDRAGIEAQAPGLHWPAFAEASGHPEVTAINVESPAYLSGAAKVLAKAKPAALQAYLRWQVLHTFSDELPEPFVAETFDFYGKQLRGQKELEARWKRCVSATEGALTHPLGRLYAERAFAGESKAIALDLIQRIEAAFEANLPSLAWMDDTTRERAVAKVKAIFNKIGYPDKWRDYSGLEVAGGYLANTIAAQRFDYEYQASKIGKPVDRDEWRAGPPVVNASYSGTRNEMWFPAGILQAPFFDREFPMAMNFGGIGVVMGHELTHGFDDQGRKYDGSGMLQQWWGDEVIAGFESRTACVDKVYSAQEVEPGLHVDGKLTMGENVADMGGLKQAFGAYKKWAGENGGDATPHVEGLTNEQLVFVNFAQVWCTVATPEYLRVQVATDPHSPSQFRVNVPASMTPEFAAAFQCAEGTPMNPAERCEVW
ncbi:MAG: M13 family metallopeptidase [Myxococcales bacterium]|nr:M13 family metallopeptidase [Myxococcales bacterium]